MFRRNTYLWSVIVIGAIVTSVGGTGIFAVFTDRATQGPNTAESGARPKAADVQIAQMIGGTCTSFQEDLATALWSFTNLQPVGDGAQRDICLKNNGGATVEVSFSAIDLARSDLGCTGDESSVDPSCALPGQPGQLADVLQVDYGVDADCDGAYGEIGEVTGSSDLVALGAAPADLTTGAAELSVGATMCLVLTVSYPSTTSLNEAQAAQSDSVSWKFAFDAVAN